MKHSHFMLEKIGLNLNKRQITGQNQSCKNRVNEIKLCQYLLPLIILWSQLAFWLLMPVANPFIYSNIHD